MGFLNLFSSITAYAQLYYKVWVLSKYVQALFFPGVNIFKIGLASKNPEPRRPASLIKAINILHLHMYFSYNVYPSVFMPFPCV